MISEMFTAVRKISYPVQYLQIPRTFFDFDERIDCDDMCRIVICQLDIHLGDKYGSGNLLCLPPDSRPLVS
jgi:hypothetical protein